MAWEPDNEGTLTCVLMKQEVIMDSGIPVIVVITESVVFVADQLPSAHGLNLTNKRRTK